MLPDLRARFDEVLTQLEAAAGWVSARVQRPVPNLGSLGGVETGIRQLRRTRPLETERVEGLEVPTLPEMARVTAWLLVTRDTVRDSLDTVVLLERLGAAAAASALRTLDELYEQPTGASVLAELVERLARRSSRSQMADLSFRHNLALRRAAACGPSDDAERSAWCRAASRSRNWCS